MKPNWMEQVRKGVGILGIALLASATMLSGQVTQPLAAPVGQPSEPTLLSPDQLDNLVAPVALYPDPLLSQVLAASTYPLEVVEAEQWLQQNQNLKGQQLMDAARQQSWDPSVQAMVAFPDALTLLSRDVQWTTDLGNAFLAQQKDVMAAIQRMRRRAQQNGKLTSTAQETVTTEYQDGDGAVVIQPANPEVIYVPVYNPVYVWGPPVWGYYPPLWYPAVGFGFGFGPGIYLSGFFPGWGIGWGGWGLGWGWGCGWFGGGIFVNNFFFNHYGFYRGYYGGRFPEGGRMAWAHDSFHREGVPYANHSVAAQYNNSRFTAGRYNAAANFNARSSSPNGAWRNFNNNAGSSARGFAPANRAGAANFNRAPSGGTTNRSYSTPSYNNRSYAAPNTSRTSPNYTAPNTSRSYAAPNTSRSYAAPNTSRSYAAPNTSHSFANPGDSTRSYSSPNYGRSYASPSYNNRSYAPSPSRSYSAPNYNNRSYAAPNMNRSYSAPNAGARSFSAPRSSGGGGFGGGHSAGGGGSRGGRR